MAAVSGTSPADPGGAGDVAALVDRARLHDRAATQALFRMHVVQIHRLVRRLVGARGDVDDVVQSAFFEAFRSLRSFRGESAFATWLTRIAVRVTMNAIGRRQRQPASLDTHGVADPPSADADPERTVAAREGLAHVDALLARMRPKRRAAFVLHVLEGHPIDEVARILATSPAAVRVRIHDARREIERSVRDDPSFVGWLKRRKVRA